MEIVINRCFGGFGLSALAMREYAKRKGFEDVYIYKISGAGGYEKIKDDRDVDYFYFCLTKDFGDRIPRDTNEVWEYVISEYKIQRDDPDLIDVVKTLGEKANGRFSELSVVEIPDNVNWEINEYDGIESIHEKHRVWG